MELRAIGQDNQSLWLTDRLGSGLAALLAAARYATDLTAESQQLSLSIGELTAAGFEVIDCRWLMLKGFVEHLTETTFPGDGRRSFRSGDASINNRSSFLLTSTGILFAEQVLGGVRSDQGAATRGPSRVPFASTGSKPRWDSERQELWYDGRLVKQYRIPSPNQVAILCAFEEEGWPAKIDDPLPSHPEIDSRRRLNDAIRNLNRSRIAALIKFSGDGSGQGVLWELEPIN